MRIPGPENIGNATPNPQRGSADTRGVTAGTEAIGQLANVASGVALQEVQRQRKEYADLQSAKSVNALLDYSAHIEKTGLEVEELTRTGQLDYRQAQAEFEKRAQQYKMPELDIPDHARVRLQGGMNAELERRKMGFAKLTQDMQREDFKSQFYVGLDNISKLAAFPGANIEELNGMAEDFVADGIAAGIPESQLRHDVLQFKEGNWFNQAEQRSIAAETGDDVESLRALQHDLTAEDGFYMGKLSADKRNSLLKGVSFNMDKIRQRNDMAVAKREAAAERALLRFDSLIATGAAPSLKAIETARTATDGTSFAGEFGQRLEFAGQVQEVLNRPIAEQIQLAASVEQHAMGGADDARQVAQARSLSRAIGDNIKTLTENPLQYIENRTGKQVPDLSVNALLSLTGDPPALAVLSSQLQDRAKMIKALETQSGMKISNAILKPHEADQLSSLLNSKDTGIDAKRTILQALKTVSTDTDVYKSLMASVAQKSPVMAYAGMVSSSKRQIEYDAGLFSATKTFTPSAVAETMLKGDEIISGQKFKLPSMEKINAEFSVAVGDAYRNHPDAYQADLQAVRAYYAGAVSEEDTPSDQINQSLLRRAIGIVAGATYESGDSKVLAPMGMSESEFADRIEAAWQVESTAAGYDGASLDVFGLEALGNGRYAVMSGTRPLVGANGGPMILNVED